MVIKLSQLTLPEVTLEVDKYIQHSKSGKTDGAIWRRDRARSTTYTVPTALSKCALCTFAMDSGPFLPHRMTVKLPPLRLYAKVAASVEGRAQGKMPYRQSAHGHAGLG